MRHMNGLESIAAVFVNMVVVGTTQTKKLWSEITVYTKQWYCTGGLLCPLLFLSVTKWDFYQFVYYLISESDLPVGRGCRKSVFCFYS